MAKHKTLYFAGPLFSESEQSFNRALTDRLENELGLTVFLPQRDGYEFARIAHLSPEARTAKIFELDRDKVFASDIFLFILDGRVPDEGAALELGLAYAHKALAAEGADKLVIGLMTDVRAWLPDQKLNPMLAGALEHVTASEDELLDYLKNKVV